MRRGIVGVAFGLVCVLACRSTVHAFFLDDQRRFDVRMRAYSQWSVMAQSSEHKGCITAGKRTPGTCPPQYSGGDLAQIRNFYNPEFDAKLLDFTSWMNEVPALSWISPEDFRFRFAWWGFYDYGVYDADGWAGNPWNERRQNLKARFSQSDDPGGESFTFEDENKNAERIYGKRNRINELYVDYTKGPVFLRVGRQAISWGESDTIAQMDITNPFDLTLGAPGFFQDTDEARIPLWTLRGTFKLIDSWGPLSSTFLDSYIVPGPIDTTVPINPIAAGVSPFNPDQSDPIFAIYGNQPQPQGNCVIGSPNCIPLPGFTAGVPIHPVIVDRLPRNTWSNTRWGVRLTGVVARDYTVQTWFFRTFNQAPAPELQGPGPIARLWVGGLKPTLTDDRGFRVSNTKCINNRIYGLKGGRGCGPKVPAVTVLERQLESSFGVAASWFAEPLNAVIRTQLSFFWDELSFLPKKQLNPRSQLPVCSDKLTAAGFPIVPGLTCVDSKPHSEAATANYMRFVLGYDRFFFFRPLNPTNSFTLIAAFQGQVNMSAINGPDYRNPQTKPGHPQTRNDRDTDGDGDIDQLDVYVNPKDFEDQYLFEGFAQVALQTDYLHGRLTPRFVVITDVSGMFGFAPSMTYRFTDNLLGQVAYMNIYSPHRKTGIGTFRAHDMVQFRLTAQLN
ncbi:MAG TPA: DUF1302 family protein [Candidatus Limnocylindria bacterium]|nr:DUF1302 family protein [Candidatus Limnocylindria bacterium]